MPSGLVACCMGGNFVFVSVLAGRGFKIREEGTNEAKLMNLLVKDCITYSI